MQFIAEVVWCLNGNPATACVPLISPSDGSSLRSDGWPPIAACITTDPFFHLHVQMQPQSMASSVDERCLCLSLSLFPSILSHSIQRILSFSAFIRPSLLLRSLHHIPLPLLASLFLSLSHTDTGKFTPVTLKDGTA